MVIQLYIQHCDNKPATIRAVSEMSQIQVLKQFTLASEEWMERFKTKYETFNPKHFTENLCNELFNYYNGHFNVLVFQPNSSDSSSIHMELTSNPLQHLSVSVGDTLYEIYIFKEGFFQIPCEVEPWCAYGSYSRTQKHKVYELNFYYITKD